jgi:ferredoxin
MADATYFVAAEHCLRCGACSTLAPGIIAMGDTSAVVVRQPATPNETNAADAALFNCPVMAIRKRASGDS